MKRYNPLFLVMVLMILISCEKKNEIEKAKVDSSISGGNYTIEENKENIETSAVEAVQQLNGLKNVTAVKTLINFSELTWEDDPFSDSYNRSIQNHIFFRFLNALKGFSQQKIGVTELMNASSGSRDDIYDDLDEAETVNEVYAAIKNTFTWNNNSDSWDIAPNAEGIEFIFPSTGVGSTNDAKITISYEGINLTNSIGNDDLSYSGDAPKVISAILSINDSKAAEYSYNANYDENSNPTSLVTFLEAGTYKMMVIMENSIDKVSVSYGLTNDENLIFGMGAEATGQFSINDFNTTIELEEVENQQIITTGSAYAQILNIKLQGDCDFQNIIKDLEAIDYGSYDEDGYYNENENAIEEELTAINQYLNLEAVYADNNKKIAEMEAYIVIDEYERWVGYDSLYNEIYETDTSKSISMRMIFPDESKSDLEAYFGDEDDWTNLIDEINNFISDMNSSYDMDIDDL